MSKGGKEAKAPPPEMPRWIDDFAQQTLSNAGNISTRKYVPYTGETVAGATPDQQASWDFTRGRLATGADQIEQARQQLVNLPQTAQQYYNPWLQEVEQNAIANLQRQGDLSLHNIGANARNVSAFGGARQGLQEGVLQSEVARQAGDMSAQLRNQGWTMAMNTAVQNAQAQAGMASQEQQVALQAGSALNQAGAQQQAQQQAGLTDQYQRWLQQQQYPLQQLQIRLAALQGVPYMPTAGKAKEAGGNILGGVLGGAASGAGMGTAIMPGWGTAIGAVAGGLLGGVSTAMQ